MYKLWERREKRESVGEWFAGRERPVLASREEKRATRTRYVSKGWWRRLYHTRGLEAAGPACIGRRAVEGGDMVWLGMA